MLLRLRSGCEQLTHLPRLLSDFPVVKVSSFVQKADQWHPNVSPKGSFHAFIYARRSTKLWFSIVSEVGVAMFRPAIVRVTRRLANYAVRADIGITTIVGTFSTGLIRNCKWLPSTSQKIFVILHSPKIFGVHLQLKLILLSGVFVYDCKIDISKWCIQMISSSFPHSRSPGKKNVCCQQSSDVFEVDWYLWTLVDF